MWSVCQWMSTCAKAKWAHQVPRPVIFLFVPSRRALTEPEAYQFPAKQASPSDSPASTAQPLAPVLGLWRNTAGDRNSGLHTCTQVSALSSREPSLFSSFHSGEWTLTCVIRTCFLSFQQCAPYELRSPFAWRDSWLGCTCWIWGRASVHSTVWHAHWQAWCHQLSRKGQISSTCWLSVRFPRTYRPYVSTVRKYIPLVQTMSLNIAQPPFLAILPKAAPYHQSYMVSCRACSQISKKLYKHTHTGTQLGWYWHAFISPQIRSHWTLQIILEQSF